ncbi:DUF3025 domain-containing protein [Variovorax sp. J22R133]|uniref:DUF3025 domain-containing protein n=1 Tax=Variovorax brevis TaxID=3053503 RepID=UPI00257720A9|nr:DUF3025 domain-containing protein [Variovorax sp. J22R133]MDM0114612.1 DUF3025 domain-containing protein [Variovorax sp. J22R133]
MKAAPHGEWAVPDLRQPWFEPYASHAPDVFDAVARGASVSEALNGQAARIELAAGVLRFVPPGSAPADEAYEAFIARTACVPTRDNLHDLFNGLAWLRFPRIKRRLNELQAAEIARMGIGASRGPLRDALTLFDENGALFDAPPVLQDALIARDWQSLFIQHRAKWAQARVVVFGHALLEKLAVAPRKALTAHVLLTPPSAPWREDFDASLASALHSEWFAAKPFSPLPVMGIPGWNGESENFSFYDDSDVFRPAGRQKKP